MPILAKKTPPPSKRALYRIRSQNDGKNLYLISKLDGNLDVKASYAIYEDFNKALTCNCPSRKRPCKHIAYLHKFHENNQIDGFKLYDPLVNRFVSLEDI